MARRQCRGAVSGRSTPGELTSRTYGCPPIASLESRASETKRDDLRHGVQGDAGVTVDHDPEHSAATRGADLYAFQVQPDGLHDRSDHGAHPRRRRRSWRSPCAVVPARGHLLPRELRVSRAAAAPSPLARPCRTRSDARTWVTRMATCRVPAAFSAPCRAGRRLRSGRRCGTVRRPASDADAAVADASDDGAADADGRRRPRGGAGRLAKLALDGLSRDDGRQVHRDVQRAARTGAVRDRSFPRRTARRREPRLAVAARVAQIQSQPNRAAAARSLATALLDAAAAHRAAATLRPERPRPAARVGGRPPTRRWLPCCSRNAA